METQEITQKQAGTPRKRIWYYDLLRILGAFLVIVNHTNSSIFLNGTAGVQTFLSLSYFFFCKLAVAVFFMLSGALLLSHEDTYKNVFTKKLPRIIVPWILLSVVYFLVLPAPEGGYTLKAFLEGFKYGTIANPFWFLYTYFGILLMLPFLQRLVGGLNQTYLLFLVLGWAAYTGIYRFYIEFYQTNSISGYFQLPIFSGYMGYLFLGLWLSRLKITHKRRGIAVSAALCLIGWAWPVAFTYRAFLQTQTWNLAMDNILYLPCILLSAGTFVLTKILFENWEPKKKTGACLSAISACTFGVYLLHALVIHFTSSISQKLTSHMNVLLAMIVWEVLIFAISMILTGLWRMLVQFIKTQWKKRKVSAAATSVAK